VDLVIIGVGAKMVSEILDESGKKGISSAVIFSSGFAEVGNEEGRRLQQDLATIAEKYKIRVCGPNCVGFAAMRSNTVCFSAPLPQAIPSGAVGYVSQSATMAANVLSAGASNGIGFAYAVSSGNEAVIQFSDYIRFMLQDPEIKVVAAFVEGVKDPQKFFEMADLAIRLQKPFLVLKIGKTEKGKEAAASHTGALTGSYDVYQAVFKQKGIISVDSIEQMVESIKLFSYRKPIKKGGLAIIAGSGGICGFLADRSEEAGLPIPDFSPATTAQLQKLLPSFGTVHNPLDTTGQARTETDMFSNVCRTILNDEQIDILVHALGLAKSAVAPFLRPLMTKFAAVSLEYPEKLITFLACSTESFTPEINDFIATHQIPILQGGRTGLTAIRQLLEYNHFLYDQKESKEQTTPAIDHPIVKKWQDFFTDGKEPFTEKVGKNLLADYGIRVPKGTVVFSLEEAQKAARVMGYPVVLKIHSSKITHKTEVGGVKLNLADETALRHAFSDLEKVAKRVGSDEGFLIEEMIAPEMEMILGMKKDPTFGPVIMLGLGGIFTELFKDVTFRVAPFSPREARAMVQEIRGAKLLSGFRGKPKCDLEALVDTISRMARMAQDLSSVVSQIDINPMAILAEGKGVVALDTLFITERA
jgi:acetate---CoA ligase (ADP-forming)